MSSIGFMSPEDSLRALEQRLKTMTDAELIRYGRSVRSLAYDPRPVAVPDDIWHRHLALARQEWRRRHPKKHQ
jgi:hypothetical protein